MPAPLTMLTEMGGALLPYLAREHRPEPLPPQAQYLVADVDAALGQKVLQISQAQRVLYL
jgi:hypothetical protein